jgi:Vacuolar protein sorting-associated protein 62
MVVLLFFTVDTALDRANSCWFIATLTSNPKKDVMYVGSETYQWIYDDAETRADDGFSAWRTIVSHREGYYRLGDLGSPNGNRPDRGTLLVKGSPEVLKPPVGYTQTWNDGGSGGRNTGVSWEPTPPSGFTCLGHVWTSNHNTPSTDYMRCVRNDFVETVGFSYIWNDRGSGARLSVSVWKVGYTDSTLESNLQITKSDHGNPVASKIQAM